MLAVICGFIPQVIISLWGGVWADRYNRKYLIMLADAAIAAATFLLAVLFFLGFGRLELILIVLAVRSVGAGIQMPAVSAVFPQIVPQNKLTRVNGINQTINSFIFLLSPAAGGVLLGYFNIGWALMADVITAAIAIGVLSLIKIDKIQRTEKAFSVVKEIKEGLSFAFGNRLIKALIICYAVSFFLITPASFLTPILIERLFGNNVWYLTANELVWTIGTMAGGLFVSVKGGFKNKIHAIAFALFGFGITFAFIGMAKTLTIYLIIMGISGFFLPIMTTAQTVLIQEKAEEHVMGRVFSILHIITGATMPTAMLLFGPLADVVAIGHILIVSGFLLAVTGIVFSRVTEQSYNARPQADEVN